MGHLIFWAAQFVNRKMYESPYSQNPDFRNATISVASCCTWKHPKTLRWPKITHASCQNDLAHPYDTKYTVSQFVNPTIAYIKCSKIHIIVHKTESRSFPTATLDDKRDVNASLRYQRPAAQWSPKRNSLASIQDTWFGVVRF